ncbi:hypothetical protein GCM10022255_073760 [Dactylosporangium darangshiense]|uniref:Integral membrane protein n=1 Tax=Dactylosporangium darangshiense TaxID=579108 RepID=A0ABP8DJN2_9ACTN
MRFAESAGSAVHFIIHLLLNLFLIVGSFVPFLLSALLIIYRTRSIVERMIRGLALFAGTLTAVGVDAAGISVARFTVDTLATTGFAGFAVKAFVAVVVVAAGYGVGKYLITKLRTSRNIAIRGMIFIGMIVHIELLEIYVDAVRRNGFTIGSGAIPNAGFMVGLIAYVVLNYDPQNPQERVSAVLRDVWRNRSGADPYPGPVPPPRPRHAPRDDQPPPADPGYHGPYTDHFPEQR